MPIKPTDIIKSQYPNSILVTDRNYIPKYLKGETGDIVLSVNDRGEIIWRNVSDLGIPTSTTSSGGAFIDMGERFAGDAFIDGGPRF